MAARWERIVERHQRAVRQFVAAGDAIAPERWRVPIAEGKWTPEQITQHVIQAYEVLTRQLRTGEALQVQTGWWLRHALRVLLLRPIMWTRRIPRGAMAARELIPRQTQDSQAQSLVRLRQEAATFEAEVLQKWADGSVRLTHHIFGDVDALSGLDFTAVHTDHHGRQMRELAYSIRRRRD